MSHEAVVQLDTLRLAQWTKLLRASSEYVLKKWDMLDEYMLKVVRDPKNEPALVLVKTLVQQLNERWTDLPYDNGSDVYRTLLPEQKLLRFVLLLHHPSLPFAQAKEYMGITGGQVAVNSDVPDKPLERLSTGPEKLEQLFHNVRTNLRDPYEMCKESHRLLYKEREFLRYWLAYRWFYREDGVLPKLQDQLEDTARGDILSMIGDE